MKKNFKITLFLTKKFVFIFLNFNSWTFTDYSMKIFESFYKKGIFYICDFHKIEPMSIFENKAYNILNFVDCTDWKLYTFVNF